MARTNHLTPEGRESLSRLAKERTAKGDFGGHRALQARRDKRVKPPGVTKRRQRITKSLAEAAMDERNSDSIIQVFKDAIHPNQPMSVRLKGATAWAEIAAQHAKLEVAEVAADQAQHSRDELLALLSNKLTSGPTGQILRQQLERQTGIVDAEIVEEVDGSEAP